jgi:homoserine dehydrogenase
MQKVSLCLAGFGHVGRAFARLIQRKRELLELDHGVDLAVKGIATAHHGAVINLDGVDLDQALAAVENDHSLDTLSSQKAPSDMNKFIPKSEADFLIEISPVNYDNGEPAVTHIRTALEAGMHAVSANKGPIVHALQELDTIAKKHGRYFLFESAVMDGAPVFSVFREALPALQVIGFEGILNSCTNLLIEMMENGQDFEEAVTYAQSIGIAETDPSGDIDGWDAAIKVAALVTVLMGQPLKPQQVVRTGIRDLSLTEIQAASREGNRWKLVCRAGWQDGRIISSVSPEIIAPQSPLFSVNGTSSFILFKTDVLPGLGIQENNPGPETTAYGLLADILNILKKKC